VIVPIPLLLAIVTRLFGPTDSEEVRLFLLFKLHGLVLLPLLATALAVEVNWRRQLDTPRFVTTAAALGLAILGAGVGMWLNLDTASSSQWWLANGRCWLALTLPIWAAGHALARMATRWAALRRAAVLVATTGTAVVVWSVALQLHAGGLLTLAAASGGILTLAGLGVVILHGRGRGVTPWWLGVPATLPILASSAVAVWMLAEDPGQTQPVRILSRATGSSQLLIETLYERSGTTGYQVLELSTGKVTPLPRRTQRPCFSTGGRVVARLHGPYQRLFGISAGAYLVQSVDGRRERLRGGRPGRWGSLQCSQYEPAVLWSSGPGLDLWNLETGGHRELVEVGAEIAFPCFALDQPGVLFRVRGDDPPPLERRFLPLDMERAPETGPTVDRHRCLEAWIPDNELRLVRPMPGSGDPWLLLDGEQEHPLFIDPHLVTYDQTRRAAGLVPGTPHANVAVWESGNGLIAMWAAPDASQLQLSPEGEWVLLVSTHRRDGAQGHWWVHEASTGELALEGTTSQVRWREEGTLLELSEGQLRTRNLVSGFTQVLMP